MTTRSSTDRKRCFPLDSMTPAEGALSSIVRHVHPEEIDRKSADPDNVRCHHSDGDHDILYRADLIGHLRSPQCSQYLDRQPEAVA
jgi:hypothetical protein